MSVFFKCVILLILEYNLHHVTYFAAFKIKSRYGVGLQNDSMKSIIRLLKA